MRASHLEAAMESKLLLAVLPLSFSAIPYGRDAAAHGPQPRTQPETSGFVVDGDEGVLQAGTELGVIAIKPSDDTIVLVLREDASGRDVSVRVTAVAGRDVAISVGMSVTVVAGKASVAARVGRRVKLTPAALTVSARP
jgi:hypothetical protein